MYSLRLGLMGKLCRICKQWKQADDFYPSKKAKDRLRGECKECESAYQAERRKNRPNIRRQCDLKAKYGITVEEYDAALKLQDGKCACCRSIIKRGRFERLAVDHCHTTGLARGLLCCNCNLGIGLLGDNLKGLKQALDYLENSDDHAALRPNVLSL